ncbi:hypothetical protein ANN_25447 [Periplaneta americana]|uniref:LRRCT domain-containing protein n=1 Tax=Periplaneta americana TaxID=6978 RepID=A0ABQ8S1C5_PERAM|nr:hypothetical protein ANN_25447 [Periplaneta americana]
MKKATYLFLALAAFGNVLCQETEGIDRSKLKHSITVLREVLPCPQECICNTHTKDPTNKEAVCPNLPKSLHPNIRYLKVTGNIGTISTEDIQEIEGQLYQLDLSGCNISRIQTGAFDSLVHLVSLNLSNNNIKTLSNDMFACPRLIYLYMDGNALQTIQNTAFSKLQRLMKLHLQHNLLQEISFGLPITLTDLDISHNRISTITSTTDLNKLKLKILNVCGNTLREFPPISSSKTLEVLCLEGEAAAHLPTEAAANFPSLTTITLIGSQKLQSEIDVASQSELAKMRKLIVLTIVNYHLKSLTFLAALDNLDTLNLHNVTIESYNNMDKALQHLTTLNIDWSPKLVKPILGNKNLLIKLSNIKTLSLKHTGLVSLSENNIPAIEHLDISENPLHCDCKLLWIQHKERDHLSKFLHSKPQTICNTPPSAARQTLQTIVNIVLCGEQQREGTLEQQSEVPIQTTTMRYVSRTTTPGYTTTPKYISMNSTGLPQQSQMTEKSDHSTLYIILGCVVGILILVGIVLTVVLTQMKKRRKCQISPNGGETPMQQQEQQPPIKQAKSSDHLLKK